MAIDKGFTGSMVKRALDLHANFTASIDPAGPGEIIQGVGELLETGLSLDPDNNDLMSDL